MRYSRQTKVVGEDGQEKLSHGRVAIVGMGALGSINAELLCRAGVGKLILIDDDVVELSNLQRQGLYTEADVGKKKVIAAKEHLMRINSEIKIKTNEKRFEKKTVVENIDLLLDCTDNLDSRFLLSDYAVAHKLPCVFCMVVRTKGMLYVSQEGKPSFREVFAGRQSIGNSDELGILNVTTHLAATLQAAEALKLLLGEEPTQGLINFDAMMPQLSAYAVKARKKKREE